MSLRVAIAATAAATALLVSGCSGDEKVPQVKQGEGNASTASEPVTGPSDEAIKSYFEAYATDDPTEMEAAISLAAPGSIAAAYLTHQAALATAYLDSGSDASPSTVKQTDDGYELCDKTPTDGVDACVTYENITADGDKLASFTIKDRDLAGRLLVGNKKVRKIGSLGTVELVSAYQAAANDLFVILRVKSSTDGIAIESRTAYQSKDGRQSELNSSAGPTSLLKDSVGYYALVFSKAGLGGKLHLEMYKESGGGTGAVDIPIR